MNKSNLIWGIICLVIASALAVANLTLPSENLMFQIGDKNMPWFPVIVLAIVGIVLLANPNQKGESKMSEQTSQPAPVKDPEKAALNKRLETAFWGLFLILLGGQWLMPKSAIPNGVWSIGVGVILLGLNAARYFSHIRMSGFTTFLGILSLVGGLTELIFKLDFGGAFLLIILGAYLILKPWFDERKLFGKAEES
jgi:hypothetical protein